MGDTCSSDIESVGPHAGSSPTPMVEKTDFVGALDVAGTTIQCAVLPGGQRIISQRGFMRALGLTHGGKQFHRTKKLGGPRLPNFLASVKLKPFVSNELVAVLSHPVHFRHSGGGKAAHGLDARALPLACEAWLKARRAGVLQKNSLKVAERAEAILLAVAHVGIVALIDEITGYQGIRPLRVLQAILERYLTPARAQWAKTFPDDFYVEMFRLKNWSTDPRALKRPGVVGRYTNDFIYDRLAPGVLKRVQELNPSSECGGRKSKHHQFFTRDRGIPELKGQIRFVVSLMRSVDGDWQKFKSMLDRGTPRQGETLPVTTLDT